MPVRSLSAVRSAALRNDRRRGLRNENYSINGEAAGPAGKPSGASVGTTSGPPQRATQFRQSAPVCSADSSNHGAGGALAAPVLAPPGYQRRGLSRRVSWGPRRSNRCRLARSACPTSDTTVLRPCSPTDGSSRLVRHPEGHGSEDLNRRLTSSRADGRRASAPAAPHAPASHGKGPGNGGVIPLPATPPPRIDHTPTIWMIPLRIRLMCRPGRGNWCPSRPGSPHPDWSHDHEREEGRQDQDRLPPRKATRFPRTEAALRGAPPTAADDDERSTAEATAPEAAPASAPPSQQPHEWRRRPRSASGLTCGRGH